MFPAWAACVGSKSSSGILAELCIIAVFFYNDFSCSPLGFGHKQSFIFGFTHLLQYDSKYWTRRLCVCDLHFKNSPVV